MVLRTDGASTDAIVAQVLEASPGGVDHIVEVAFHANIATDHQVLRQGGSIASYATGAVEPPIPFWDLVFKNVRLYFLGSDDFPMAAKRLATTQLSEMLEAGWAGYHVADGLSLDDVALAHELVEKGGGGGRVVLDLSAGAF